MVKQALLAAAAACLLVSACGDGSSGATPAASTRASATAARPPTPAAFASPDVLALAALLEGRYTGTWSNSTFGTTGPITVDLKLDRAAGTVAITLALGGNVFGAPAPPPETITIKPDASQLTYQGKSAIFGDLTAVFALAGLQAAITMKGANVPNPRVAGFDAAATLTDPRSFGGRYTVTFKDGSAPAQGTFTLAKLA